MPGRYYKLFAIARELQLDIDELRDGAAQLTGKPSLRSLSNQQLIQYIKNLNYIVTQKKKKIHKDVTDSFQKNEILTHDQIKFLIDLICHIFKGMPDFREFLNHYYQISHERFLTTKEASKIIKALMDMRARGYTTCNDNSFK